MTTIFWDKTENPMVTSDDLDRLIELAKKAELRRARYCAHPDHNSMVQEMIIAFCKDSVIPIHRHTDKSESFHVILGEIDFQIFDDEARMIDTIRLGDRESGKPFYFRHEKGIWHTVKPLSRYVVVHETSTGPFHPDETEILKEG